MTAVLWLIEKLFAMRWGLLGLAVAALFGVAALGGATIGLRWTNTEAFCIGCHEMRDNVYAEYKGTIHDSNRTGVRATCPDCHVPKTLIPLLIRKVKATGELWGKITGKIDTTEKFRAARYDLALKVWTEMKENDSLECRNCHTHDGMSKKRQSEKAWDRHQKGQQDKMTCIDCHFAIAHTEPEGAKGPRDIVVKR